MKRFYTLVSIILISLLSFENAHGTELKQKLSGTATMSGAETDITVTLPLAVDMSRSVLFFTLRVDDAAVGRVLVGGELSSTNTVEFHRNASGPVVNISYQVLEFTSGVSVQRGVEPAVGPTTGVTLPTAVNLSKSFATVSYKNNGGTFGADDGLAADITSSNNMNLVSAGAGIETAYWQVVECTDCNVQKTTSTLTGASVAASFTPVNQSKTLLFTSQYFAGDIAGDDLPRTEFTANDEITHTRTGNGPDVDLITYVVEFTDATTTVQHGSFNPFTTNTIEAETLSTTVNTLGSMVLSPGAGGYQGSGGDSGADNPRSNWFTLDISNGSTLEARRASGAFPADLTFQVAEFEIVPPQIWYVFVNGDWNDPNTWTLDASTAPIFNNPSNEVPDAGDQVYIYSGKEVTTDIDNIEVNFIKVDGVLDLANSTGHDFGSINGQGFIKTSGHNPGSGLVDNFPAGSTNASIGFGDAANGGTLIVEGAGDITFTNEFNSGNSRFFRNIRVDRTNPTDKVILGADLELTGNLDIRSGDVQINDNTNTTPLLIEIREDVEVNSSGSMSVSTADAYTDLVGGTYGDYHRSYNTMIVGGDFTNRGEVRFTNQTNPDYTDRTTSGAVSLVFNRARNTVFNCQGTTDLYNVVIDKGVDQTYELEINATQRNYFALFGRLDLGNNGSGGNEAHPEQQKALYIANGTLRLTGEVYIPTLNEGGRDYEIGERGALILDSPNVFVQQTANNSTDFMPTPALSFTNPVGVDNGTGNNSFTLFGRVQVNDGHFKVSEADHAVSLLFRSASPGVVEVNDGLFEANQFTYSNTATTDGNFGVVINGGTLRVNGGSVLRGGATDQAAFHLPFEGNIFTMTGGVLEVLEATQVGGLLINSAPSNINVTGGTVRLQTSDNNRFRINSSAALFNLELNNVTASTNANARFFVEAIDGIAARDLKVQNNLTIETGTTRGASPALYGTYLDLCPAGNCRDLEVGGDLRIEDSAVLDVWSGNANNTGSATVTFNSSNDGVLYIGDITTYDVNLPDFNGTPNNLYGNWEHPFYNITIDKPGATLSLASKLPGKGNYPGSNFKNTANGGKNVTSFASNLVLITNEFKLLSGTLSQIDPLSDVTYDQSGSGQFGVVGDPVAYSLRLFGSNVVNQGTLFTYQDGVTPKEGIIVFRNGGGNITLNTTEGAFFGNLRMLVSSSEKISITSDLEVGRLEVAGGLMDIGTHNLKVDVFEYLPLTPASTEVATGEKTFNASNMIRMAGNASDGGLSIKVPRSVSDISNIAEYEVLDPSGRQNWARPYNQTDRIWFPIGTATKYTPAICFIKNEGVISGDEYITVKVVNKALQTIDDPNNGDRLTYYWNVTSEGFTTKPEVSWVFQYDQSDVQGNENQYVPGRVEDGIDSNGDGDPFSRIVDPNVGNGGNILDGGAANNEGDLLGSDPRNILVFNGSTTNAEETDFSGGSVFSGATINWSNLPGNGYTFENANYTAARSNKFNGTVRRLYAVKDGAWHDFNTWSTTRDGQSVLNNSGQLPSEGDVVIIGTDDPTNQNDGNWAVAVDPAHPDYGPISIGQLVILRNVPNQESSLVTFGDAEADRILHDLGKVTNRDPDATDPLSTANQSSKLIFAGPGLPGGDFGEFATAPNTLWTYSREFPANNGGVPGVAQINFNGFTISDAIGEYPNLQFEETGNGSSANERVIFPDRDITINGDIRFFKGPNYIQMGENNTAQRTIVVKADILFRNNNTAFEFPAAGEAINFVVEGDIDFDSQNDIRFLTEDAVRTANDHTFELQGNMQDVELGVGNASTIDFFDPANTGNTNVNFVFGGLKNNVIPAFRNENFFRVKSFVMNKGIDLTYETDIQTDFITASPADFNSSPLEILNGKLILNNSDIDLLLADQNSGDFNLPNLSNPESSSGSGGLEIRQGTARIEGDDTGITLDGLLSISGGTLDMSSGTGNGNNYIQYGTSGNAEIVISAGVLDVGSQLRRSLTSTEGVLSYRQSGGDARFGINNPPNATRGVFEILNVGSEFEYTGGTFAVVNDNNSATVASLRLTPSTSNVGPSQVINVGTPDTDAGQNNFGIQSSTVLGNLTIGSDNGPIAKIYSLPLEVNSIEIGSGGNGTFDANGINLTVNESLINNGAFEASGNVSNEQTTFFPSSSLTTISGSGTSNFYNFDKNGMGELSITKDVTVLNQTSIRNGILNTNSIAFFAEGDVLHDATHSSTLESDATQVVGFIFNGNQKQLLTRSGTGLSSFGMLRISNASGVEIDGSGEDFEVTDKMTLSSGKFEIGGNLLIFPVNSYIENAIGGTGVNDFNINNMIQTNSSIKDFGVRKFYNTAVDGLTTFTYPVGLTAYTPVKFDRQTTINGFITARPVADLPPIAEDAENTGGCSDGVEIVDSDNVLQYHWIIRSQGISGLEGNFEMYYDENDVSATNGYDETNYGAARLYNTDTFWDKNNLVSSLDEGNNIVNFDFSNNDDATISGIYTAGVIQDGAGNPLCGAIPDEVPQFVTITSGMDLYDQGTSYDDGIAPPSSTAVDVTVRSGFTLQLNNPNIRMRRVTIEENAVLEVNSGILNTNLGFIEGTGTLKLTVDGIDPFAFPAGDYSEFFPANDCVGGGGLEFAGTGSYNFPTDIPVLRNVIFSGSGVRNFPIKNTLKICEDLEILNTVSLVVPDGENSLTVLRNIIKSDGSAFDNGGGNSRITMAGSSQQSIVGDFTGANSLNQLRINNAAGLTIVNAAQAGISANGDIEIDDELLLSNGIINTDVNNSLELLNGATVNNGSIGSHINGPFIRNLNAVGSTEAVFPVGDGGRFGRFALRNTTRADNWTVTFYDSSPDENTNITTLDSDITGDNPVVSQNQYWEASTVNAMGNDGRIRIDWDEASNVADGAATEEVSLDQLRVVSFKTGDSEWKDLGGGINASGTASQGTLISTADASFSTTYFTFGAGDAANNSLPVELTFFTAENKPNKVELKWQTASEKNNDFFEVQRSFDGKNFEVLGLVEGAGDSKEVVDYNFDDYSPLAGDSYYRLRQVDYDGVFEFSEVVKVNRELTSSLTAVPNPTDAQNIKLRLSGFNSKQWVQVQIFDLQGRRHYKASHNPADFGEALPISSELNSGIYIIDVQQGNIRKKVRLMVR